MEAHSSLSYTLFKRYIRLTHETLLVRHRYVIGRENLPQRGESYFIVSNHENTANDPLNIILAHPDTLPVGSMARANMFELNDTVTRFLRFIRIVPAYRFEWEGGGELSKNTLVNKEISQRVNGGEPFVIFPSAGHSQGHYLMHFTTGISRIALQAIADNGWTRDVKIVPTALFYADYFAVHSDVVWIIGKPISLMPYKEMYKEHPYTVMRQIRDRLWQSVHDMMLDEGEADYAAVDFLRRAFSPGNANGLKLPERLAADKEFVSKLRANSHFGMLRALARSIMKREDKLGVSDECVERPMSIVKMVLTGIVLIALLPLWIVSLWPHLLCYRLPLRLLKDDTMFTNSYRYIISALFLYPLTAIITIAAFAMCGLWWVGLLWVAIWIPTGIFGWHYWRHLRSLIDNIKLRRHPYVANKLRVLHKWVRSLL